MTVETRPFDAARYLDTAERRAAYLAEAFASQDPAEIAESIGVVARAEGMSALAERTGLGRESLYRALGPSGNPELKTLIRVLGALGLGLAPVVQQPAGPPAPAHKESPQPKARGSKRAVA